VPWCLRVNVLTLLLIRRRIAVESNESQTNTSTRRARNRREGISGERTTVNRARKPSTKIGALWNLLMLLASQ